MNLPCEWFPAVGTAESAEGDHVENADDAEGEVVVQAKMEEGAEGDHVENADDAEGEVVVQAKMMMKALLSCALTEEDRVEERFAAEAELVHDLGLAADDCCPPPPLCDAALPACLCA